MDQAIKLYCEDGMFRDECGRYKIVHQEVPLWVRPAMKWCGGCRDDFYNGRLNCTGHPWCWNLKKTFARRKTRPACWHG